MTIEDCWDQALSPSTIETMDRLATMPRTSEQGQSALFEIDKRVALLEKRFEANLAQLIDLQSRLHQLAVQVAVQEAEVANLQCLEDFGPEDFE